MLARLTTIITEASLKHKEYILKVEKSFKQYMSSTDKSIDMLIKHDSLRDGFVNEKVDKFLASIPPPKDADNEYILGNLKVDVKEYLRKIDKNVNILTKTNIDKIQITQDKSIKDMNEKLNSFMSQKLDEYREIHKVTVDEAIRLQVAKIPKAKDGQDAEVDYDAIGEMIAKEISSNKFVKNIEFIQNTNELKIIYTDETSKKLPLPKNKVIYSGSGGNTFSQTKFNSRNEIEGSFKYAYLTSFKELIYSGLSLASIEIYTDETKKIKLFTKTFIYNGDNIQNVILVDETTGYTLTKTINYNSNGVLSIKSDIIQ